MTTTAALAAQYIDLDGYTLKISGGNPSEPGRYYASYNSWTSAGHLDYEITRNDGHVEWVNSARFFKEIYASVGRYLQKIAHTLPAKNAPKLKVGDYVLAHPESTPNGLEGRVWANHPVSGLVWVQDNRTGRCHAVVKHAVEVLEEYIKPSRKALAELDAML